MYNIGDVFIYGTSGVCRISDIQKEDFDGKEKTYYILTPVTDLKSTIFVPVDNEKLISKMKKILSAEEIMELIKSIPAQDNIWIENINLRREKYRKIIGSADREELLSLLKTLYERKNELMHIGKNLSVYDERFLHQAQKIIHGEIALVLQMQIEDVEPFIIKTINAA